MEVWNLARGRYGESMGYKSYPVESSEQANRKNL